MEGDPAAADNGLLRIASCEGHIEVIRLLLQDKKVDPRAQNSMALSYASSYGHIEVVRLLMTFFAC